MHMIALCLIRLAMLEASCLIHVSVGQISFARALKAGPSFRSESTGISSEKSGL